MLGKANRFHGLGSLRFVYRGGQTIRGPFSSLKYSLNHKREKFRVAVIVSRKVSKSAVVRNRIRRRVYEALRAYQTEINQPYDLVFTIFSAQAAEMPFELLKKDIASKLKEAKILH